MKKLLMIMIGCTLAMSCATNNHITSNTNDVVILEDDTTKIIDRFKVLNLYGELGRIGSLYNISYPDTTYWTKLPLRDNNRKLLHQYVTVHSLSDMTIITTVTKFVKSQECEVKITKIKK